MGDLRNRIAEAIAGVQLFSRFNDWTSDRVEGLPVEICRYGSGDEDEIVVVNRRTEEESGRALHDVVKLARADAVLSELRKGLTWAQEGRFKTHLTLNSRSIGTVVHVQPERWINYLMDEYQDMQHNAEESAHEALMNAAIAWLEGE